MDARPSLEANRQNIPVLSPSDEYKYLRIQMSASSAKIRTTLCNEFVPGLTNITKAPLKPQQRLDILRNYLFPRYCHELVLTPVTVGWLDWFDSSVRAAVRQWLKLLHDTATAFFYARIVDRGLGLSSLRFSIPIMKKNRVENMTAVDDPVTRAVVMGDFFRKGISHCSRPLAIDGRLVSDKESIAKAWASSLYTKLDERCLSEMSHVEGPSDWVSNPLRTQNGTCFIRSVKVHSGLLYSKSRAFRDRPEKDIRCDACL